MGEPSHRVARRVIGQVGLAASLGGTVGLLVGAQVPVPLEPGPIPWWLPDAAVLGVAACSVLFTVGASYVLCRRAVAADPAGLLREE